MTSTYFIIAVYLCLLAVSPRRYVMFLPTLGMYPENTQEIHEVKSYVANRTYSQIQLFRETDQSVSSKFAPLVKESVKDLDTLATSLHILLIVYISKYFFNRARPHQIDPHLNILSSNTADTPSYPSGHALQSYYLAKVLSQRYPDKQEMFEEIAEECAMARVYAGLHYPSDNRMSRWIVDHLPII